MRAPTFVLASLFATAIAVATAQAQSTSFTLGGEVVTPRTYRFANLKALPATKLDVFFLTGAGPVAASYTGVLLWDLLTRSVIKTDPAIKNDILRKELTVTGADGYTAAFALGELDPMFGGAQVIVAYEENGKPIAGTSGFARVVVPGDKAGGRFVFEVAKITVGTAP